MKKKPYTSINSSYFTVHESVKITHNLRALITRVSDATTAVITYYNYHNIMSSQLASCINHTLFLRSFYLTLFCKRVACAWTDLLRFSLLHSSVVPNSFDWPLLGRIQLCSHVKREQRLLLLQSKKTHYFDYLYNISVLKISYRIVLQ